MEARIRPPRCGPRRSGFTVVEVLVVFTILAFLAALALGVIQTSRSAALRIECLNNLGQIGRGLATHQTTHGIFPPQQPSSLNTQGSSCTHEGVGWQVYLLPYIEQPALWNDVQLAYQQEPNPDVNWLAPSAQHGKNLRTIVPAYLCPADGRLRQNQVDPLGIPAGYFSYAGVTGYSGDYWSGLFGRRQGVAPSQITDGLSQTLAIGERPPPATYQTGWWYMAHACDRPSSTNDFEVAVDSATDQGDFDCTQENLTWPDGSIQASQYFKPGRLDDPCSRYHYWSLHSGGANFLFIDGSVRFLPYSAKFLLRRLATIAGDELSDEGI